MRYKKDDKRTSPNYTGIKNSKNLKSLSIHSPRQSLFVAQVAVCASEISCWLASSCSWCRAPIIQITWSIMETFSNPPAAVQAVASCPMMSAHSARSDFPIHTWASPGWLALGYLPTFSYPMTTHLCHLTPKHHPGFITEITGLEQSALFFGYTRHHAWRLRGWSIFRWIGSWNSTSAAAAWTTSKMAANIFRTI